MVLIPKDRFQKSWLTSSGVAFHLTTPSEEETDRLIDCASRRLACLSTIGAWQSQSHPMFCGPSWVDHSCVPLCSSTRRLPNRVALEEDQLFRRLFPTGPKNSEELLIACRRRSVLPSPSASFLPLPAFRWRRGLPSRSPFDNAPRVRVGEVKNSVTSLWITGILGTTADCIVTIAIRDSRDSLSVLLRDPDNGRIGPSSRVRRPSRFVPPAGSAPAAR